MSIWPRTWPPSRKHCGTVGRIQKRSRIHEPVDKRGRIYFPRHRSLKINPSPFSLVPDECGKRIASSRLLGLAKGSSNSECRYGDDYSCEGNSDEANKYTSNPPDYRGRNNIAVTDGQRRDESEINSVSVSNS